MTQYMCFQNVLWQWGKYVQMCILFKACHAQYYAC